MMNKIPCLLLVRACALGLLFPGVLKASVKYDAQIPQVVFAAQEINAALKEAGRENLPVSLVIKPDADTPEAFQIKTSGSVIEVTGSDANGAMYGGIEVANYLKMGLPIKNVSRQPFVEKRGIKSNLPIDVRAPSYCDKGTAAQINIVNIWDYEGFWVPYLDDLARYRYNLLSLWTTHPYVHMAKVPGYEDASLDDVYRLKEEYLVPGISNKFEDMDKNHDGYLTMEDGTIELVKKITIDEKVEHWKKVFQHAEDRGIEICLFSWTVFVSEARGKYGITEDQSNPKTIDFVRESVKEALLTYPQVKGIGVTSGENDRRELDGSPDSTEWFIRKTYAQAVLDAKQDPRWVDRDIRFIFRRHGSECEWVNEVMADYDGGVLDTSVKYAVAHMYSSRRPQEWEKRMDGDGWLEAGYKVWLNLRNDDLFMHRFGSPDFLRELIRNFPHESIRGFYMGSDGYFWGKEFISKVPELSGQLEIEKHWYNFRMLGEMAYTLDLDDNYWKAVLKHRYPGVDVDLLFNAWETVSEVVPQLNRSVWAPTDGSFAPEMCQEGKAFLSVDSYYLARPPMILRKNPPAGEQHCVSVNDWASQVVAGGDADFGDKLTPLEVADQLDSYAEAALTALLTLKKQVGDDAELRDVLLDMESMARLGQYYADKQRAASHLKVYRLGGWKDKSRHQLAVDAIEQSRDHWQAYADVLESHYNTSLHAKTDWFRWYERLKDVEGEVAAIKGEGALPTIAFTGLTDDTSFSTGHNLDVALDVTAAAGLHSVRLYLNGILVGDAATQATPVWTAADHNELNGLKEDWYSLRAVAVDQEGFVTEKEVYVQVGKNPGDKEDWKLEPYAVLMTDGQEFHSGNGENDEERKKQIYQKSYDGIGVTFQFDAGGKLVVRDHFYGVSIIRSYSKADKVGQGPRRCEFKDGVVTTYNLVEPVSVLWSSRGYDRNEQVLKGLLPSEKGFKGPYQFVITRDKNFAIYGTRNGKPALIWSEKPDWKFWEGRFKNRLPSK
ncbi:hypothetical protein [Pontiella sulfatireligans]|uniref:Beta-hexosaminidase bacterial type N-terminal domain-containing protein n=1 Tax=Pontiella sulfatireligans TaxID=2750658 RepID=A0A6C2UTM7_9BACT|nr:hypothetical protein [Pontiella sulfatireligans]VGO23519.1 hypothetical protein SCARR_05626 [Pontiella sulfatireligans]